MTEVTDQDLMLNLDEVNEWFSRLDKKMATVRFVFEAKVRPILNQMDELELSDEMQKSIDGLILEFSGMLDEDQEPPNDE
jgi:hypothetical protein